MKIFANFRTPFDQNIFLSPNTQKYAKLTALAIFIIGAFVAAYYSFGRHLRKVEPISEESPPIRGRKWKKTKRSTKPAKIKPTTVILPVKLDISLQPQKPKQPPVIVPVEPNNPLQGTLQQPEPPIIVIDPVQPDIQQSPLMESEQLEVIELPESYTRSYILNFTRILNTN